MRTLALLTILVLTEAAPAGSPIHIIRAGSFHGDEVPPDTAGRWFALVVEPNGASLRRVRVSVALERDPLLDDEREKTGKRVDVSPDVDPIILVRGLPALRPGRLVTAFVHQKIDVDAAVGARLPNLSYNLSLHCSEQPAVEGQRQERCNLTIRTGAVEQVVFTYGTYFVEDQRIWASERAPEIVWAGDLDADGRLDLLLDTSDHYNVSEVRLYLSSRASSSRLVGEVARFIATGC